MDWEKDFEFIKQGSPLIIAVDFDDTLANAGEKYPEIGEPTYLLASLIIMGMRLLINLYVQSVKAICAVEHAAIKER